jgi:PBSX family phage terminase large subunit
MSTTATDLQQPHYVPHGVLAEAWACHDPMALVDGPAGTGKSRMWLERIDALARKYPGSRHFICRKTRKSITTTAQVTFENFVLPARSGIKLHKADQVYPYPNGSIIGLLGLDDTEKTKSLEADTIYINEATECAQEDVEMLIRSLRWPAMPWKQIAMDCNPDAPTHWLFKAFSEKPARVTRFVSRHKDNPYLWHQELQRWTEKALGDLFDGKKYIENLGLNTGVRLRRLLYGEWCAAEGVVYDTWDDATHVINWFRPPNEWPRYWSVDFGYTDPFCLGMWTVDPDGRLILYKHIYFTQRLVEDHAETVKQIRLELQDPAPREIICDWDAEGRATLERHLGMQTTQATKHIAEGIQAVQSRLKVQPDGLPRLLVMRDSLVEYDDNLKVTGRPTDGPGERPGYVWDQRNNRRKGELPIDKDNHFMDMERYLVAHFDLDPASMPAEHGASIW